MSAVEAAELELRARLRVLREVRDAAATGVRTTVAPDTVESLEAAAVVAALRLSKAANDTAMRALHSGKMPWSPESLMRPAKPENVAAALRWLKVAEVALEDQSVRALISKCLGSAGPGRVGHTTREEWQEAAPHASRSSVSSRVERRRGEARLAALHSPQERFACSWPYVATLFNQAAATYVGGDVRRASAISDRAMTLLAATGCEPEDLVTCALHATDGALPVAQQLVAGIVSHGCIARALAAPESASFEDRSGRLSRAVAGVSQAVAGARLDAAVAVSALGVRLAKALDEHAVSTAAAELAAADDGHEAAATLGRSFPNLARNAWPGLLAGRVAAPLLVAFALFNHGVVLRDVRQFDASMTALRAAERSATLALHGEHAFTRLVRYQIVLLQERGSRGPTGGKPERRCAAAAEAARQRPHLAAHLSMRTLQSAIGRQRQERAMSAAAVRRSSAGPVAVPRMAGRRVTEESWLDDLL